VTAASNGTSVALSGGTIPANGSCQVTVNMTSNTPGTYANSTGVVTSTNAGSAGPATAQLVVVAVLAPATAIPTLAQWALVLLTLLLGFAGAAAHRSPRRK